jgi:cytochrome c oxidase subunit 2
VDRSNPPLENLPIEIAWTGIPLVISIGLFVWSTAVFLENKRMPAGALEIYMVGKQWMWKAQHPQGRWENNELHVPAGRPIQLTMTSEDVIHSFFVPAFRIHQDVIPGEYTHTWFTATTPGTYHLFCAQFCGTLHSQMVGTVTVMEPAEYEDWLSAGPTQQTLAEAGQTLFIKHGCSGCHGANTSLHVPSLEGIFGRPIPVQLPPAGVPANKLPDVLKTVPATTVVADRRYIHDSIALPMQEIAAGYPPIMPTFKNRLTEQEILQLVAYIESLSSGKASAGGRVREGPARIPSVDEYRARTGFTPTNVPAAPGGSATGARPTTIDQRRTTNTR